MKDKAADIATTTIVAIITILLGLMAVGDRLFTTRAEGIELQTRIQQHDSFNLAQDRINHEQAARNERVDRRTMRTDYNVRLLADRFRLKNIAEPGPGEEDIDNGTDDN